jgi:uncharacterized membrane-anchored protein YitT (DUF2179 family)
MRIRTDQKQVLQYIKNYLQLTVGAVILAVSFNVFMAPQQISPGGITGLTLIITNYTDWSDGLILLILQILMIFLGFWFLGRFQFLFKAIYVALIFSFGVEILKPFLPPQGITNDLLLNSIFGGLVGGIGGGIVFWGGSSVAGTGVISRIIQLKTGVPLSQLYIFVDGFIILLQALVLGWDLALYSMIMLFINGLASDYVLEGPSVISTVFVITRHPEEISTALMEQLHVGVTSWNGTGMFTHQERTMLFCTVSRFEKNALKQMVHEIDPSAFIVVGSGHQAVGGVLRARANREPEDSNSLENQENFS